MMKFILICSFLLSFPGFTKDIKKTIAKRKVASQMFTEISDTVFKIVENKKTIDIYFEMHSGVYWFDKESHDLEALRAAIQMSLDSGSKVSKIKANMATLELVLVE